MNHHTEETKCPLCEEKLSGCDPLVGTFYPYIKSAFPDCHISWGFRNKEEQNDMVKRKKSKRLWPNSAHNVVKSGKPSSIAIDLFRLNEKGKAEFKEEYFLEIAQFIKKMDIPFEWSGDWVSFIESNHFQLKKETV